MEEIDIGLEAVSQPYPDGEEVMATPLGFLVSSVLHEKGLGDLQKVAERTQ